MANTKKYVSLDKLSLYNEKIKKVITDGDAAAEAAAKAYADGLAVNYDAAGSAATAYDDAKAYADGKDAAIQAAAAAASAAAAAASAADGKAVAAQGEVDALETYVGTFTASEGVDTVVKYIDKKTSGIATEGAMTELGDRVTAVEGEVATIKGDYLNAADKTELEGKITAVQTAVDTEKARAEGAEGALDSRVTAVEGAYVAADTALKTELEGKISAKADTSALNAEIQRATQAEAGLQAQIDLIMDNPDTKDVIDSITEFTQYVTEHGTIADGFRTDIDKNKTDIAAEVKRAGEAESALSGRIDILETINHDAYIAADTTLKTELEGKISAKADTSALTSAVEALENADNSQVSRIEALEAKFTGEGNVSSMIATAKQEAIDSASADATSKANAAEAAAKGHADSLNTAMNTRVEALEAIDHDHSNKAELDLIASGDKAKWDAAATKAHEHNNLTVLEGITSTKVAAWDAAEGNAKTYASGLNTEMNTRVVALETWHTNFTEVSEEEINALFQ